jgi:regulatory protein
VKKRPEPSLRTRALQYLARREYSRAELAAKLRPYAALEDDFEQLQPNGQGSNHARFPHPNPLPEGEGTNDRLRGFHVSDLESLLDDLTASGYLSDERAATQLLHARRPRFGTQRITHEMHQKGISDELIAQALPGLKETELASARSVWQRKFGTAPQDAKEKARQMRFMQSRGFSLEAIFKVLAHGDDLE